LLRIFKIAAIALIWLETTSTVDNNRSEWIGEFAGLTALMAMLQDLKWAAIG
jgi:hypothetical protein